MSCISTISNCLWTLTEYGLGQHQNRTHTLPNRSITVGRSPDATITIQDGSVSKVHAELILSDDHLTVRDLGSRNGTFVNCKIVQEAELKDGDLIQFANAVYRVGMKVPDDGPKTQEQGILPWAQTLLLFDQLISERAVQPHYQPVIQLGDSKRIGFEILARSKLEGLRNPAAMFQAADRLNQNATLSELMRDEGLRVASTCEAGKTHLFLNTHPCEVVTDRLLDSLKTLRETYPTASVVLEIHEAAVVESDAIVRLRSLLNELDMGLSYDDFGAGQGRLLELGEAPPDVLKFDMSLIRDIDKAPPSKQEMLQTLVKLAIDLGCTTLAEGVETKEEHEVCLQMGFQLGQGFLYGRPSPLEAW